MAAQSGGSVKGGGIALRTGGSASVMPSSNLDSLRVPASFATSVSVDGQATPAALTPMRTFHLGTPKTMSPILGGVAARHRAPSTPEHSEHASRQNSDGSTHRKTHGENSVLGIPRTASKGSKAGFGTPLLKPVPRVDSDDKLYQETVKWEVDSADIDFDGAQRVGSGAHAEVFRARWRGTPVAVKRIMSTHHTAMALTELRHEIAVMAHMHHPRVVQFLGVFTKGEPWLILFEFMKGGSVASWLDKRRERGQGLPIRVAGRWALDTAQGLRYLHEHKPLPVVHRDLKPQNLLIDGAGHVKISDFGLAKVVDMLKQLDESYTMTGETGSYRFMAPEVFRHEKYSEKVDIYAFGMIMAQLFHPDCAPPFYEMPPVQAAEASALRDLRPEPSPKLPPELRILMEACWHPDPKQRPTALECCERLEKLFPDDGSSIELNKVLDKGGSCSLM